MRIISGKFKGKSIVYIKSKITRPLKDSVKENIFNIILHSNLVNINIENSQVLDLYSGIGSFGLECISRGAKEITFVEKDKDVLQILKKNLLKLSASKQANIIMDRIDNYLKIKSLKKFILGSSSRLLIHLSMLSQNHFQFIDLIKRLVSRSCSF